MQSAKCQSDNKMNIKLDDILVNKQEKVDSSMTFVLYSLLLLLWLSTPGSVVITGGQAQMVGIKVRERGNDGQCHSMEEREGTIYKINRIAFSVGMAVTSAYTCNGTPGWRRVAFINMTDTSYNCPTGLNLTSYSKRTCGRSHTTNLGCSSTTFSVGDLPYSRVCGRIRGYQFGQTSGFLFGQQGINSYYVNGVSLTHGVPGRRQHIWTFAAELSEVIVAPANPNYGCPCDTPSSRVPAFIGNDYFCESALHSAWSGSYFGVFFPDDVLWDGQDCVSTSTCCQFNSPPWFTKNLPNATTDDIELRICDDSRPADSDVPLELIELYVQ